MSASGPVVLDLRALQSPSHRGRGIGRYALGFALALERRRPDLVGRYLLAPDWPPPSPAKLQPLLDSGKVAYAGTDGAFSDAARVYHSMSPFELDAPCSVIWPAEVEHRGLRFSVTAYDLIPLVMADEYLADPRQRRRYRARLEVVRLADAVLTISAATRRQVVELLGISPDRVVNTGTGTDEVHRAPGSAAGATARAQELLSGLRPPFVLYPGGSDGRKNVEGLIRGFARARELNARGVQLVVPCALPEPSARHLRHVAELEGVGGRVLLPGYVSDEALRALYQAAALVAFPSLAEGFGLPVAEALASGAVVVASDRPPMDELVPAAARFDPEDAASIAAALERGITDEHFRAEMAERACRREGLIGWADVADSAAKVFEQLAARPVRPWKWPGRLAVVSPFPPISSGVATYSANLARALGDRLAGRGSHDGEPVTCFADGRDRDGRPVEVAKGIECTDARGFRRYERVLGGFEQVLYVLGNSEYHTAALTSLRERPGVVLAHDVDLSNLLRFSTWSPLAVPGGLEAAVRRSYTNALPEGIGRGNVLSREDAERFGLLFFREVAMLSPRLLVNSEAARRLAVLDVGPGLAGRIGVLPFALALPADELQVIAAQRAAHQAPTGSAGVLVASFGIVHDSKLPHLLLEAVAALGSSGVSAQLALVGPISGELRAELSRAARQAGLAERVSLTGEIERSEYLSFLARADVAVQLRAHFGGEASAAAGDCLAAGLPTVVSDIGWLGELPGDTVVKLEPEAAPDRLTEELSRLLSDEPARRALSEKAAAFAASRTFGAVADALLAELGL